MIRKPYFAGSFYSDDKSKLNSDIEGFLSKIDLDENDVPKILISPHAGFAYSGSVATYGYSLLKNSSVKNVILLGSAHQSYFEGCAVWDKGGNRFFTKVVTYNDTVRQFKYSATGTGCSYENATPLPQDLADQLEALGKEAV